MSSPAFSGLPELNIADEIKELLLEQTISTMSSTKNITWLPANIIVTTILFDTNVGNRRFVIDAYHDAATDMPIRIYVEEGSSRVGSDIINDPFADNNSGSLWLVHYTVLTPSDFTILHKYFFKNQLVTSPS